MVRVVIFDAYGTLLDVHTAMAQHADRIGPNWEAISADWRMKQLEYSWVRTLVGPRQHRDFWRLTEEALAWTAVQHGLHDAEALADVLQAYRSLHAFPDAADMLRELQGHGIGRCILSNGEPAMLEEGVRAAGLEGLLDAVLSAESVGVYKPDPRVYLLATSHFGLVAEEMGFVSSNPWDAFGAANFGFRVFWINRSGRPAEYGLNETVTVVSNLAEVPRALGLGQTP